MTTVPFFAPTLGQVASRTYYEVARLSMLDQWWQWLVLLLIVLAIGGLVWLLYRLDGVDIPRGTRWALMLLRLAAFAGLLLFFLKIEKRSERKLDKHSRAVLLIDTSQSMGLTDAPDGTAATSRMSIVTQTLESGLIQDLRDAHDVVVYRFDEDDTPVELAMLPRTGEVDAEGTRQTAEELLAADRRDAQRFWYAAAFFLATAGMGLLAHLTLGQFVRNREGESWALLVFVACLLVAGVFAAIIQLRQPAWGWRQIFLGVPVEAAAVKEQLAGDVSAEASTGSAAIGWLSQLSPQGLETRLGSALQYLIDKERGGPVAGIAVFTDGNSNAGTSTRDAVALAQQAEICVHFIGFGTDRQPTNVRLIDCEAPERVYPGDQFKLRGFVQAFGLAGQQVTVELTSESVTETQEASQAPRYEDEQLVTLGDDGEVSTVEFDVVPGRVGERIYTLTVRPPVDDFDATDNAQAARVEIVDRKLKVLLLAGGPTREYRFLRDLCYRDQEIFSSVYLQSSPAGAAQEANEVLDQFPSNAEELFEYDCLLAFDPDWQALNDAQIELVERWIAERAAGLLLIAGPVHLPEWTTLRRETRAAKTLKGLYPINFFRRASTRLARRQSTNQPTPLVFSDEGRQSRDLWLGETPVESERLWAEFPGVYTTFPVSSVKAGATLLASISDRSVDGVPAYMVEQFYGAGRVFYIGSGEMWRLRALDPNYFEQLYTQLIRHISQGRLLRDSSRGVLMLGKNRCTLGETVVVRASLLDAQFRPYAADAVEAEIVRPDGIRQPLQLVSVRDAAQAGNYSGQFTATLEGEYRVELVVPETDDLEQLSREVRVRVPELEVETPQRNDAVMSAFAAATGGNYYPGTNDLGTDTLRRELSAALVPQDQVTYTPGSPDSEFQVRLLGWLMALICGTLSLEWLIRRLNKLA